MEELTIYLEVSIIGIVILLFIITLLSYRLAKNLKVLILSIAFLIFAIKIMLLLASESLSELQWFGTINALLVFDFIIIIIIYFSLIKK
jgi:hypothetical protein